MTQNIVTNNDIKSFPTCWTCGCPNEGAGHSCIQSLKRKVQRLEQEYGKLREQALDAGITLKRKP